MLGKYLIVALILSNILGNIACKRKECEIQNRRKNRLKIFWFMKKSCPQNISNEIRKQLMIHEDGDWHVLTHLTSTFYHSFNYIFHSPL